MPVSRELAGSIDPAPGRIHNGGPVAIIDIGSNSVRLVVYERLSRSATPLFNEKELCELARGEAASGRLNPDAIESALASLRRFVALCAQIGVAKIHVLATAATRDAADGAEFIASVEEITGAPILLLSAAEEARLSALGVVSGINEPDGIAGDLGGGSLELVSVKGKEIGIGETFPLGGIRLQDAANKSVKKAGAIAAESLSGSEVLVSGKGRPFYAIGGTWRSLARLHMRQKGYPLNVMQEYRLDADEASEFCRMVSRRDLGALDSIEVVSRARRALLPYGAAVLSQIIKFMKPSEIVMSALGVREGRLYDLLDPAEKARDPLIVACGELAYLRSRSPRHVEELYPWTDGVFQALRLDENDEERRLRHAACLLADIGWRAHPDYRGEQSLNVIAYGTFTGIDHPGRAYLALANFYQHEGLIDEKLSPRIREITPTRLLERARALGAALRVAYLISGAMPDVIGRTRVVPRENALTLILPSDLGLLAGSRVLRRLGQLAKLAGMEAVVEVE